jgi:hypothetical protein
LQLDVLGLSHAGGANLVRVSSVRICDGTGNKDRVTNARHISERQLTHIEIAQ